MSTQHAQYMLLFLVVAVNSDLTLATHSYALLIMAIASCVLGCCMTVFDVACTNVVSCW